MAGSPKTGTALEEAMKPSVDALDVQYKNVPEEQVVLYRRYATESQEWRDKKTKRLLRKVDLHLLPLLLVMWILNFLDRSNLAQARLGTLEKDLGMHGTDFNLATSILYVGYICFQVPSNLLLTRARPSIFLGIVMSIWGVVSAAQAATKTFGDLLATRTCLGIVEAPFIPGSVLLMSSWYTKSEVTYRLAWFFSGTLVANAIGGLLAAAVLDNLDGAHGIAGWRWLFIIEGSVTVAVAIASIFALPNFPHNTKWLSDEERSFAQFRLAEDAQEADDAESTDLLAGLKLALRDYRFYMFALLQHITNLTQVFGNFFPSIVRTLGYGRISSLLLTVPVWIAAALVSIAVGFMVGKRGDRSMYIICFWSIACIGNIITIATTGIGPRYFGMFLMAIGGFGAYPVIISWIVSSFPRPTVKRSAIIAMCNSFGNAATIYGSYMFPISASPRYIDGGSAAAALSLGVCILAFTIRRFLIRENKRLEREEEISGRGARGEPAGFRYTI